MVDNIMATINPTNINKPTTEQTKSTNLESFLASTQNLVNKKNENIMNNPEITTKQNIVSEPPKPTATEAKLDDYGLNETINFINEYKRGLKNFNNKNN